MGEAASTTGLSGSRFILLTDIVSSSRLNEQYPSAYDAVLDRHNALIEQAVADCGGEVFKNIGDGYYAFFDSARDCIACAAKLASEFARFPNFAEDDPFLVRIVAHQGEMRPAGTEYFGPALNRASRLCQVCHPRQVILSESALAPPGELPENVALIDLGEHHLRDLAEPEHLYQLNVPSLPHEFPPLATLGHRPNNLIGQPNAFVGRERELVELKAMLLDKRRLITITAPGGYGKSRLAAHLCADLLNNFERGVFFVELAPLRDHSGITTALANATGFQFYGTRDPQEQLVDYLRDKEMLICFDNFEHVLAGAAFVGDILAEAGRVKVVVTSREPLRISREQVYALQPLAVDRPGREDEWQSDAMVLFADRATLADASFALDEKSLAGVQAVCQKLDGIPLAIELAAAWMDTFTVRELLTELDRQLELTARLSDIPGRHRSLRASLDWSWNLLGEKQRETLMRLGTFRGGCFAEAASAVLGVTGMALRQELAKLRDKSWLFSREVAGQTRYLIRDAASHEYVLEKIGEIRADDTSRRYTQAVMEHARYFSALMEREGKRLHGHGQLEALQIIGQEIQNIYEALDTLVHRVKHDDGVEESAELLLPIARWLWEYLVRTSAHEELEERYQVLKDTAEQADGLQQVLVWALLGCSFAHSIRYEYDAARRDASRAKTEAEALGDWHGVAASHFGLFRIEFAQGNYEAARDLGSETLTICREIGDRHGTAEWLNTLGYVMSLQGDYDAARQLCGESQAIHQEIGDRGGIADALNSLGNIECAQGNYEVARELYADSVTIYREIGSRLGSAWSQINLGSVESAQGNYDAARELYTESLAIFREVGARFGIAGSYLSLGRLEHAKGNYIAARELYAESLAILRKIGSPGGTCLTIAAVGCLLATGGEGQAGAVCLHGARYQADQLGLTFDPMERELLEQGLAIIEHPESGLPPDERERLNAAAEKMSLDELAAYTMDALEKLRAT